MTPPVGAASDHAPAIPVPARRHPHRARIVLALLGATVGLGALALFALRPAPLLGVSKGALEASVGARGTWGAQGCRTVGSGEWNCNRHDSEFSSTVMYRVRVDGMGCWKAVRIGNYGEPSPKRLSGCLTIASYLFG